MGRSASESGRTLSSESVLALVVPFWIPLNLLKVDHKVDFIVHGDDACIGPVRALFLPLVQSEPSLLRG